MLTFTLMRNLWGNLVNNATSSALSVGDTLMSQSYKQLTSARDWDFLQRTKTASTVASQQFYNLPGDYDKLETCYVTIGDIIYTPKEAPSRSFWDRLNYSTTFTSDIPEWFFVFNGTLGFWPIPSASTSDAITYVYRKRVPDLNIADYTTGNISAITTATTAVTGSGSSWSTPMAGRYLRATATDTANGSGDGLWYEISSVGSATTITLVDAYLGQTISTNTAYTIGQVPVLPEPYQVLPVYRAAQLYYMSIQPEAERADRYRLLYEELYANLLAEYGSKTSNVVLDRGYNPPLNPNLFPYQIG